MTRPREVIAADVRTRAGRDAILRFEQTYGRGLTPRKALAIRTDFGISPTRYFARLNRILDDPTEHDNPLVFGLIRLREDRQRLRWPEPDFPRPLSSLIRTGP